jgi:hypothetical protein
MRPPFIGRDTPKIFTATYNYTEKGYSQNSIVEALTLDIR